MHENTQSNRASVSGCIRLLWLKKLTSLDNLIRLFSNRNKNTIRSKTTDLFLHFLRRLQTFLPPPRSELMFLLKTCRLESRALLVQLIRLIGSVDWIFWDWTDGLWWWTGSGFRWIRISGLKTPKGRVDSFFLDDRAWCRSNHILQTVQWVSMETWHFRSTNTYQKNWTHSGGGVVCF